MTPDHHAVTMLQTLLRADPELQASLREAADLDQFAQIAADSARRHGANLDVGDLRAQIEASLEQASAATAEPHAELTDQQMEEVVGANDLGAKIFGDAKILTQWENKRSVGYRIAVAEDQAKYWIEYLVGPEVSITH